MNRNLLDNTGRLDYRAYVGDRYYAVTVRTYIRTKDGKDTQGTKVFWVSPVEWQKIKAYAANPATKSGFINFGEYEIRCWDILSVQNLHVDNRTPLEKRLDKEATDRGEFPPNMPLWLQVQNGYYEWDKETNQLRPTGKVKISDERETRRGSRMAD